jgi:Reverse transcriptase (RNA-dependent DNA polymerase)
VSQPRPSGKSFTISKWAVQEAWRKVKANKGAPGVDGVSIEAFEKDLKNNLYRVWNRMSSGTWFPPPVKAVEIPKAGGGVRVLGVPTVADRVAQTVVAMELEKRVEPMFHPGSYGYRPCRSALDAVGVCRQRCWKADWVIDLDIQKFFDTVDHDLMVKAVQANTDTAWVVLYVRRWLAAPLQRPDGVLEARDRGTPQGSAVTPPTQWVMWLMVTLRVGVLCVVGGALAEGDAVSDGDLFGSDEDVFDEQSQDASAFVGGGGFGFVVELGQEAFQVAGEGEVGLAVGELGVQGLDLVA